MSSKGEMKMSLKLIICGVSVIQLYSHRLLRFFSPPMEYGRFHGGDV
jgi:hypothetical protein